MNSVFNSPLTTVLLVAVAFVLVIFNRRWAAQRAAVLSGSSLNLVGSPPPRPNFTLTRQPLADIGTIELPTSLEWEQHGNQLYHAPLGLVIVVQQQAQGQRGYEQAYLDSYNKVNIRDALRWQRGPEQLGQVQGIPTTCTNRSFNNGTAMVTRDYIFFAENTTVLLQSRMPATHATALGLTDYLASTFRKA